MTFPTDSKQLNKIIDYCHKVAKAEGIRVRQSYAREIKELKLTQRFRGKSHSKKKVAKADRRNRTSYRTLQERSSFGTELLQGSFRRLYQRYARCHSI